MADPSSSSPSGVALLEPVALAGLTLANRMVIAPMCQYSAQDGVIQPWHWQHLGSLAISGAGLLIVEATGVLPEGRITPGDTGLWGDEQEAAFHRLLNDVRTFSQTPIGIQLAHAGRKASTHAPWVQKGAPLKPEEGAWTTQAPSPLPIDDGWHTPAALNDAGMEQVLNGFVESARRADRAGFALLELHGAHGYLFSEFLSPLSNTRQDLYGGSLENRMRFPLKVAQAVRAVWPSSKPLGMRLNGSDWSDGGLVVADTVEMSRRLSGLGFDFVHISSGGNVPKAKIPGREPGYQVDFAEAVKRGAPDLTVIAVGMINTAQQAEEIITSGKADLIAVARQVLDDPRWPLRAAAALGGTPTYPPQYERASPALWPGYAYAHSG